MQGPQGKLFRSTLFTNAFISAGMKACLQSQGRHVQFIFETRKTQRKLTNITNNLVKHHP